MGCAWPGPPPDPLVAPVPPKPTQTVPNVSSATAPADGVPSIVGHGRKLEDEYTVGKQIGKYVDHGRGLGGATPTDCVIQTIGHLFRRAL